MQAVIHLQSICLQNKKQLFFQLVLNETWLSFPPPHKYQIKALEKNKFNP